MGRGPIPRRSFKAPLTSEAYASVVLSGISPPFERLSRSQGQVTHVLLTRTPLYQSLRTFSFDLHVLGTPPAFALSQDQTLQFNPSLSLGIHRKASQSSLTPLFSFQRPSYQTRRTLPPGTHEAPIILIHLALSTTFFSFFTGHSRTLTKKREPGGDLLSHTVSRAVPLALEVLTAVFGMGTGVSPPL